MTLESGATVTRATRTGFGMAVRLPRKSTFQLESSDLEILVILLIEKRGDTLLDLSNVMETHSLTML